MPRERDDSKRKKPDPEPDTLKAESTDWEESIKHALRKSKPKDGEHAR